MKIISESLPQRGQDSQPQTTRFKPTPHSEEELNHRQLNKTKAFMRSSNQKRKLLLFLGVTLMLTQQMAITRADEELLHKFHKLRTQNGKGIQTRFEKKKSSQETLRNLDLALQSPAPNFGYQEHFYASRESSKHLESAFNSAILGDQSQNQYQAQSSSVNPAEVLKAYLKQTEGFQEQAGSYASKQQERAHFLISQLQQEYDRKQAEQHLFGTANSQSETNSQRRLYSTPFIQINGPVEQEKHVAQSFKGKKQAAHAYDLRKLQSSNESSVNNTNSNESSYGNETYYSNLTTLGEVNVSVCGLAKYEAQDGSCLPCSQDCLICSNQSYCLVCLPYYDSNISCEFSSDKYLEEYKLSYLGNFEEANQIYFQKSETSIQDLPNLVYDLSYKVIYYLNSNQNSSYYLQNSTTSSNQSDPISNCTNSSDSSANCTQQNDSQQSNSTWYQEWVAQLTEYIEVVETDVESFLTALTNIGDRQLTLDNAGCLAANQSISTNTTESQNDTNSSSSSNTAANKSSACQGCRLYSTAFDKSMLTTLQNLRQVLLQSNQSSSNSSSSSQNSTQNSSSSSNSSSQGRRMLQQTQNGTLSSNTTQGEGEGNSTNSQNSTNSPGNNQTGDNSTGDNSTEDNSTADNSTADNSTGDNSAGDNSTTQANSTSDYDLWERLQGEKDFVCLCQDTQAHYLEVHNEHNDNDTYSLSFVVFNMALVSVGQNESLSIVQNQTINFKVQPYQNTTLFNLKLNESQLNETELQQYIAWKEYILLSPANVSISTYLSNSSEVNEYYLPSYYSLVTIISLSKEIYSFFKSNQLSYLLDVKRNYTLQGQDDQLSVYRLALDCLLPTEHIELKYKKIDQQNMTDNSNTTYTAYDRNDLSNSSISEFDGCQIVSQHFENDVMTLSKCAACQVTNSLLSNSSNCSSFNQTGDSCGGQSGCECEYITQVYLQSSDYLNEYLQDLGFNVTDFQNSTQQNESAVSNVTIAEINSDLIIALENKLAYNQSLYQLCSESQIIQVEANQSALNEEELAQYSNQIQSLRCSIFPMLSEMSQEVFGFFAPYHSARTIFVIHQISQELVTKLKQESQEGLNFSLSLNLTQIYHFCADDKSRALFLPLNLAGAISLPQFTESGQEGNATQTLIKAELTPSNNFYSTISYINDYDECQQSLNATQNVTYSLNLYETIIAGIELNDFYLKVNNRSLDAHSFDSMFRVACSDFFEIKQGSYSNDESIYLASIDLQNQKEFGCFFQRQTLVDNQVPSLKLQFFLSDQMVRAMTGDVPFFSLKLREDSQIFTDVCSSRPYNLLILPNTQNHTDNQGCMKYMENNSTCEWCYPGTEHLTSYWGPNATNAPGQCQCKLNHKYLITDYGSETDSLQKYVLSLTVENIYFDDEILNNQTYIQNSLVQFYITNTSLSMEESQQLNESIAHISISVYPGKAYLENFIAGLGEVKLPYYQLQTQFAFMNISQAVYSALMTKQLKISLDKTYFHTFCDKQLIDYSFYMTSNDSLSEFTTDSCLIENADLGENSTLGNNDTNNSTVSSCKYCTPPNYLATSSDNETQVCQCDNITLSATVIFQGAQVYYVGQNDYTQTRVIKGAPIIPIFEFSMNNLLFSSWNLNSQYNSFACSRNLFFLADNSQGYSNETATMNSTNNSSENSSSDNYGNKVSYLNEMLGYAQCYAYSGTDNITDLTSFGSVVSYPKSYTNVEVLLPSIESYKELYLRRDDIQLMINSQTLVQTVECDNQNEMIPIKQDFIFSECEGACIECDRYQVKCNACLEPFSFLNEYGVCVCNLDNIISQYQISSQNDTAKVIIEAYGYEYNDYPLGKNVQQNSTRLCDYLFNFNVASQFQNDSSLNDTIAQIQAQAVCTFRNYTQHQDFIYNDNVYGSSQQTATIFKSVILIENLPSSFVNLLAQNQISFAFDDGSLLSVNGGGCYPNVPDFKIEFQNFTSYDLFAYYSDLWNQTDQDNTTTPDYEKYYSFNCEGNCAICYSLYDSNSLEIPSSFPFCQVCELNTIYNQTTNICDQVFTYNITQSHSVQSYSEQNEFGDYVQVQYDAYELIINLKDMIPANLSYQEPAQIIFSDLQFKDTISEDEQSLYKSYFQSLNLSVNSQYDYTLYSVYYYQPPIVSFENGVAYYGYYSKLTQILMQYDTRNQSIFSFYDRLLNGEIYLYLNFSQFTSEMQMDQYGNLISYSQRYEDENELDFSRVREPPSEYNGNEGLFCYDEDSQIIQGCVDCSSAQSNSSSLAITETSSTQCSQCLPYAMPVEASGCECNFTYRLDVAKSYYVGNQFIPTSAQITVNNTRFTFANYATLNSTSSAGLVPCSYLFNFTINQNLNSSDYDQMLCWFKAISVKKHMIVESTKQFKTYESFATFLYLIRISDELADTLFGQIANPQYHLYLNQSNLEFDCSLTRGPSEQGFEIFNNAYNPDLGCGKGCVDCDKDQASCKQCLVYEQLAYNSETGSYQCMCYHSYVSTLNSLEISDQNFPKIIAKERDNTLAFRFKNMIYQQGNVINQTFAVPCLEILEFIPNVGEDDQLNMIKIEDIVKDMEDFICYYAQTLEEQSYLVNSQTQIDWEKVGYFHLFIQNISSHFINDYLNQNFLLSLNMQNMSQKCENISLFNSSYDNFYLLELGEESKILEANNNFVSTSQCNDSCLACFYDDPNDGVILTDTCIQCKSGYDFLWNPFERKKECSCNFTFSNNNFTEYQSSESEYKYRTEWILNDFKVNQSQINSDDFINCLDYFQFRLNTSSLDENQQQNGTLDNYRYIDTTDLLCRFTQDYQTVFSYVYYYDTQNNEYTYRYLLEDAAFTRIEVDTANFNLTQYFQDGMITVELNYTLITESCLLNFQNASIETDHLEFTPKKLDWAHNNNQTNGTNSTDTNNSCTPGCIDCLTSQYYDPSVGQMKDSSYCSQCNPYTNQIWLAYDSTICSCQMNYTQLYEQYYDADGNEVYILQTLFNNMHLYDQNTQGPYLDTKCSEMFQIDYNYSFYDNGEGNRNYLDMQLQTLVDIFNSLDCYFMLFQYPQVFQLDDGQSSELLYVLETFSWIDEMPAAFFYNYIKQRVIISIKTSSETVMNCTNQYFDTQVYPLVDADMDNQSYSCSDGCLQCNASSFGCDVCDPFTIYNYSTGECDCAFNYNQVLQAQDSNYTKFSFNQSEETKYILGFTVYDLNFTEWIKLYYPNNYYQSNSTQNSSGGDSDYYDNTQNQTQNQSGQNSTGNQSGDGNSTNGGNYNDTFYAQIECYSILEMNINYWQMSYQQYLEIKTAEEEFLYDGGGCIAYYVEYTAYLQVPDQNYDDCTSSNASQTNSTSTQGNQGSSSSSSSSTTGSSIQRFSTLLKSSLKLNKAKSSVNSLAQQKKAVANAQNSASVLQNIEQLYYFYDGSSQQYNDSYWQNDSQGNNQSQGNNNSGCNSSSYKYIPYRTSRLYIVMYGIPQTLIEAYQDHKLGLSLKQQTFDQTCSIDFNSNLNYTFMPDFDHDFEVCSANKSCLLCGSSGYSCDICTPQTVKDEEEGNCGCKASYDIEYDVQHNGRGTIYVDAKNIQVASDNAYSDEFNCSDIMDFTDFNNMSLQLQKLIQNDLRYLKCEIENFDSTEEVVLNAYFGLNETQTFNRPAEIEYSIPSMYMTIKNVSGSIYDAVLSNKFKMLLKLSKFNEQCYRQSNYNYSNGSDDLQPYQIKLPQTLTNSSSSLVCSAGCDYCLKNKTCEICDIFTQPVFQSKNKSALASCNCKFDFSISASVTQYDSGLDQEILDVEMTLYNVYAKSASLLDRYLPCNSVMLASIQASLSNQTKTMIRNVFNSSYCLLEAQNYSTYNYNNQSAKWDWYSTPIILITFFDIPRDISVAFDLQYFNMTLNSTLFAQDCSSQIPLTLYQKNLNQTSPKCQQGCLQCQDFFYCTTCLGNITMRDPVTSKCRCNYKIQMKFVVDYEWNNYYQNYLPSYHAVLEIFNLDLNDYQVSFDWYNNYAYAGIWDVLDFWGIINSIDSRNYQIDIYGLYQEFMAIRTVYFTDYDERTDRVIVSPNQQAQFNRTYIRGYLYQIPQRLYYLLANKTADVFVNKNFFRVPNQNCSLGLNSSSNSIHLSTSEVIDMGVSNQISCEEKDCESCDLFGFCMRCDNRTLKYFKYPKLQAASADASSSISQQTDLYKVTRQCAKVCPMSKYPNFIYQICEDCNTECGVCSSTGECFGCKDSLYKFNYNSYNSSGGNASLDTYVQNSCIENCPMKTYQNSTSMECMNCQSSGCMNCSVTPAKCLSCEPYLNLNQSSGQCNSNCSSNKFVDFSGKCQPCSYNCTTCKYEANYCTSCPQGYTLTWGNSCMNWDDASDNSTNGNFTQGNGTNGNGSNTNGTNGNDNWNDWNNSTENNCSLNENQTSFNSANCSNNSNCQNSSNCNQTDDNSTYGNNSQAYCEQGTYFDNFTNSCASCPPRCASCRDSNNCLQCQYNYTLLWVYYGSVCYNLTCQEGSSIYFNYSSNETICKNCSNGCRQCTFSQYMHLELINNDTSNGTTDGNDTNSNNSTHTNCTDDNQNCSSNNQTSGNQTDNNNSTEANCTGDNYNCSNNNQTSDNQTDNGNSTQANCTEDNYNCSTNNQTSDNQTDCNNSTQTNCTGENQNCSNNNQTSGNQTDSNNTTQTNCTGENQNCSDYNQTSGNQTGNNNSTETNCTGDNYNCSTNNDTSDNQTDSNNSTQANCTDDNLNCSGNNQTSDNQTDNNNSTQANCTSDNYNCSNNNQTSDNETYSNNSTQTNCTGENQNCSDQNQNSGNQTDNNNSTHTNCTGDNYNCSNNNQTSENETDSNNSTHANCTGENQNCSESNQTSGNQTDINNSTQTNCSGDSQNCSDSNQTQGNQTANCTSYNCSQGNSSCLNSSNLNCTQDNQTNENTNSSTNSSSDCNCSSELNDNQTLTNCSCSNQTETSQNNTNCSQGYNCSEQGDSQNQTNCTNETNCTHSTEGSNQTTNLNETNSTDSNSNSTYQQNSTNSSETNGTRLLFGNKRHLQDSNDTNQTDGNQTINETAGGNETNGTESNQTTGNTTDQNQTDPNTNSTDSNSNSTDQNTNSTDQNSNQTDPNTNSSDPNSNSTDPNTNSTDSNSNSTDPNTNSTDPNSNQTDPNTNSTDPNTNSTDPNTNSTDPSTNSTDPNTNSTDPNTNSTDSNNNCQGENCTESNANETNGTNGINCTGTSNDSSNCNPQGNSSENSNETQALYKLVEELYEYCNECQNNQSTELVLYDFDCLDTCPSGYYSQTLLDNNQEEYNVCLPCSEGCLFCTSNGTCDQCNSSSYYLLQSYHSDSQEDNYAIQREVGISCIQNYGGYYQCPWGTTRYGLGGDGTTCQFCPDGCAKCDYGYCSYGTSSPCAREYGYQYNCTSCITQQDPYSGQNISSYFAKGSLVGYDRNFCTWDCSWYGLVSNNLSHSCEPCSISGCNNCFLAQNTTIQQCSSCQYGLVLNFYPYYDNQSNQMMNKSFCSPYCFAENPVVKDGVCLSCPAGCLDCSDPNSCDVCNPFTVQGQWNRICQCDFRYEIYPDIIQRTLTIDTLNLDYNNLQDGGMNCTDLFTYNLTSSLSTNLTRSIEGLTCNASLAHSRYIFDQEAYNRGLSNYYINNKRTRIQFNQMPEILFAMFFNKTLQIYLKKDIFTQKCSLTYNYSTQIELNEIDYRNITISSPTNNSTNTTTVDPSIKDPTITLALKLHNTTEALSKVAIRCQNMTVYIANQTGFNDGYQSLAWAIEIYAKSGVTKYASDSMALTKIMRAEEVRQNGLQSFYISSNITQLLIGDVSVKITLYAKNKISFQVVQIIRFDIYGSQNYIKLFQNNTKLYYLPQNGLQLDSSVIHPWCPQESSTAYALDSAFSKYCIIYKNISKTQSTVMQNTSDCKIATNNTSYLTSQTYYALMVVTASAVQGVAWSGNYITVSKSQPTCLLNSGQTAYVYANRELEVLGVISSDVTGTYLYNWKCFQKDTQSQCTNFSSIQTQTPYYKFGQYTFTPGKEQTVTMTIVTPDLQDLNSCSLSVITYSSESNCSDLSLYLQMNDANSKNYLNPTQQYNILCMTDTVLAASVDYTLTYSWTFQKASSLVDLISQSSTLITTTGNQLVLPAGVLGQNAYYFISCKAISNNQQVCGRLNSTYNTYGLNITLTVSPSSGYGMLTQFSLTTAKLTANSKSSCSFGYINDHYNGLYIQLQSNNSLNLSSSKESFNSMLPLNVNGNSNSTLRVYARCFDSDGISGEAVQTITVSVAAFSKEIQLSLNSLSQQSGSLSSSQIIMLANGLIQYNSNLSASEVSAAQQKVLSSLTTADQSQITQQQLVEISAAINQIASQVLNQTNGTTTSSASTQQALASAIQSIALGSSVVNAHSTKSTSKTSRLLSTNEVEFQSISKMLKMNQLETDTSSAAVSYQTLALQSLQNIASAVDSIIQTQLTTNCSINASTTQTLIQSVQFSANRASANLKADSNQYTYSGKYLSLTLKKASGSTFLTSGLTVTVEASTSSRLRNLAITDATALETKVTLPQNTQFSAYNVIVLKAMQVNSAIQQSTLSSQANFASDILLLSVEAADSPLATSSENYTMQSLAVKGLNSPIYFTVPLSVDNSEDTEDYVKQCMYFDTSSSVWRLNECQGKRLSSSLMLCCSYHLTQFSVQTVPAEIGVAFERSFVIPSLAVLDILLIGILIGVVYLDKARLMKVVQEFGGESNSSVSIQVQHGSKKNEDALAEHDVEQAILKSKTKGQSSNSGTTIIIPALNEENQELQDSNANIDSPNKLINQQEDENLNQDSSQIYNETHLINQNATLLPLKTVDSKVLITENFLNSSSQPLQLREQTPRAMSARSHYDENTPPSKGQAAGYAKVHPITIKDEQSPEPKNQWEQDNSQKLENSSSLLNVGQADDYNRSAVHLIANLEECLEDKTKLEESSKIEQVKRNKKMVVVERGFFEKYAMALQFYHRLINCMFSHQTQDQEILCKPLWLSQRVTTVINSFAQINVLMLITALVSYYLLEQTVGVQIAISFGAMRCTQIIFNLLQSWTAVNNLKSFRTIAVHLTYVLSISAGHVIALVYGVDFMELGNDSSNNNSSTIEISSSLNVISRRASMNQWSVLLGISLIVEYILWDFILMPLSVIIIGKVSKLQQLFQTSIFKKELIKEHESGNDSC